MLLARLEPWHWWIGIILTVATVGAIVQLVAGYLTKVVKPQYPSRQQRRQS
jgi:uncharacterized membrane protein